MGLLTLISLVTVALSPTPSTVFYGSPDVCVLENKTILVKLDEFGSSGHTNGTDYDRTKLYSSTDGGATFSFLANLDGMFWARFVRGSDGLYLVGVDHRYGTPCVSQSLDDGATWSAPVLVETGSDWHCAPQPNVNKAGMAYFSFERNIGRAYPLEDSYVLRCPIGELLTPGSWETSNVVTRAAGLYANTWGHSEGCIFENASGNLENWLRVDTTAGGERLEVSTVIIDDSTFGISFNKTSGFDGGYTKFQVWKDPVTGDYFCVRNSSPVNDGEDRRTKLVIDRSSDLKYWRRLVVLVEHPAADHDDVGEQYPSIFDSGDGDLHVVIRTADDGVAQNYHDSNRITYMRIGNFRSL